MKKVIIIRENEDIVSVETTLKKSLYNIFGRNIKHKTNYISNKLRNSKNDEIKYKGYLISKHFV